MSSKKKIAIDKAIETLWRAGELSWKLKGKQKEIYEAAKSKSEDITTILVSRQFGKCLHEDTLILTDNRGSVKIKDIEIGDIVFAFNTKTQGIDRVPVAQKHYQGKKEVVELLHNNVVIERATLDHRWLVYNTRTKRQEVVETRYLGRSHYKLVRKLDTVSEMGKNIPHAYAIGALLGDGCSRQGVLDIHISSENDIIPKKCQEILGAKYIKRQHEDNFTWVLSNNPLKEYKGQITGKESVHCSFFDLWCKGKYAHEKFVDIEEISSWSRNSQLQFLAGLIDTDGYVTCKNNILIVSLTSQSPYIIKAFQYLIKHLYGHTINIHEDKRDKYVNGPCYTIKVSSNLFSKRLLKEISPYLTLNRKKWKDEYETCLENNTNPEFLGVTLGKSEFVDTWDIGIDTEDHLYLTSSRLVTHNSYTLLVLSIELCLKNPNTVVKYVAPKQKQVRTILRARIRDIIKDCPIDIKPKPLTQENIWIFPNGSEIQMAGTDNQNYDTIRGGHSDLCIVDEAGFCEDLEEIIYSVLLPTTDTRGGKLVLSSTPNPKDPNHPFHELFIYPAEAEGKLIKFTLHDSPMVTEHDKHRIVARYRGGETNPRFRCEYLCEVVQEAESFALPEFKINQSQIITEDIQIPQFYDGYVSMDIGVKDLTAALFAVYDFKNSQVLILDEFAINGRDMTTKLIADGLREKEASNFLDEFGEVKEPTFRVCDNDLKLIQDLNFLHGFNFRSTEKKDRESAYNRARMFLAECRIKIHPRCRNLIYHLSNGRWNKTRKDLLRIKDDPVNKLVGGHADFIPAFVYLIRNIREHLNPYPIDTYVPFNVFSKEGAQKANLSEEAKSFKEAFSIRNRINRT